MSRKERRAAAHQERKAARKAGFPTNSAPTPISSARLAANQANAKLSHGPATPEGRATSSQNRVTHGLTRHNGVFKLLPSEDEAAFLSLKQSLAEEHQPTTETEAILVNRMVESHWLSQRAQSLIDTCTDPDTGVITDPKLFSLYLRYQTTHTRSFDKCRNDLLKLKAERRKMDDGFVAQKRKEAEIAMKQEAQKFEKRCESEVEMCNDSGLRADLSRLTQASMAGGPEFARLQAEFNAKYSSSGQRPAA
jgi:hypothetical protein